MESLVAGNTQDVLRSNTARLAQIHQTWKKTSLSPSHPTLEWTRRDGFKGQGGQQA